MDNVVHQLPPVLTIKDTAAYLQRCTKTVRSRVKSGEIRSYREGHEFRIRREWLLEYEQGLIASAEQAQ